MKNLCVPFSSLIWQNERIERENPVVMEEYQSVPVNDDQPNQTNQSNRPYSCCPLAVCKADQLALHKKEKQVREFPCPSGCGQTIKVDKYKRGATIMCQCHARIVLTTQSMHVSELLPSRMELTLNCFQKSITSSLHCFYVWLQ